MYYIYTHCEIITTVKLINIPCPPTFTIVFVIRVLEIYSLSKLSAYNIVSLTIYTNLKNLYILDKCNFVPVNQHVPISPTSPPLGMTILLSASMYATFSNCTCK